MFVLCLSVVLSQVPASESVEIASVVEQQLAEPPAPPSAPPLAPAPASVTALPEVLAVPLRRQPNWRLDLALGQARIHSRSARWLAATDPVALSFLASRSTAGVLADSQAVVSLAMLGAGENDVGSATLALNIFELGVGMALDVPQAALFDDRLMPYTRLLVQLALLDVAAGDLHGTAVSASLSGTVGLRVELGRRRLWHLFAEASYVGRLPRNVALGSDDDSDADKPLSRSAVPLGKLHVSGYEAKAGVGLSF